MELIITLERSQIYQTFKIHTSSRNSGLSSCSQMNKYSKFQIYNKYCKRLTPSSGKPLSKSFARRNSDTKTPTSHPRIKTSIQLSFSCTNRIKMPATHSSFRPLKKKSCHQIKTTLSLSFPFIHLSCNMMEIFILECKKTTSVHHLRIKNASEGRVSIYKQLLPYNAG